MQNDDQQFVDNKYMDFKVSDLIQIKEFLLLNSQNHINEIKTI